jgi:hypothetical protein
MHSIAQSGAAHAAFTLLYILVQFESHERVLTMKVLTHAFNSKKTFLGAIKIHGQRGTPFVRSDGNY